MVTTLDKFGRLIIPKKFREDLRINSNTVLNIYKDSNKIIIELVENKKSDFIKSDRNKRMRKLLTNKD